MAQTIKRTDTVLRIPQIDAPGHDGPARCYNYRHHHHGHHRHHVLHGTHSQAELSVPDS